VYASPDGDKLLPLAELPSDTTTLELDQTKVPPGHYQLFIQAIGKPSIQDKMSRGLGWSARPK
jgi:hypothetical protein